jgi:membrane dipeptidase
MLIVDGHEDLAFNVLADGRDYLLSAHVTRATEAGGPVPEVNGICMLGLPEWLRAGVAVIFATITTIPREAGRPGEPTYANVEASFQQALAQVGIYRRWTEINRHMAIVDTRARLEQVLDSWAEPAAEPDQRQVGLVLLMENADSIRVPSEVAFWHEQGVHVVGPAWHSNRFSGSSLDGGPLTDLGRQLLDEMQRHTMVLDLSHMSDEACREALERYSGPIVASHSNPRRLVPLQRLLPDDIIAGIAARDGIVGIMPLTWALDPDARAKKKTKAEMSIELVVRAVDIVCELAGDARHVGIGSDFDGGQGAEAAPAEIDTIADLPRLADALSRSGYSDDDVEAIMGGNWLRLLREHLPA